MIIIIKCYQCYDRYEHYNQYELYDELYNSYMLFINY